MMAHLSDESRALGAVNCVINRAGALHGDNSDACGLEMDLRELRVGIEGKSAVIVGAGGAAASAVVACIRLGANRIIICNRTVARATRLARRLAGDQKTQGIAADRCSIEACSLEALVDPALVSTAALVINATPMGLRTGGFADLDYTATHPDCVFYDLLYAREATPFLAPAIALSRRTWDGAGMLINQGAIAFELFNGVAPPKDVMRRTLMRALGRA
jgi:shikimate dehydrogenase